jgi:uncharacterized cupin superfamily protein
VTYEVGGASSPENEYQRHAGREWGFVLEGRLEVRIGFEQYTLDAGDSISFESSVPHRLANVGDVPVHAIWFVMGRGAPAADSRTRTCTPRRAADRRRVRSRASGASQRPAHAARPARPPLARHPVARRPTSS